MRFIVTLLAQTVYLIQNNLTPKKIHLILSSITTGQYVTAGIFMFVIIICWRLEYFPQPSKRHLPGVLVPNPPIQNNLLEPVPPFPHGDYMIHAKMTYEIRAFVIHKRRYRFGINDWYGFGTDISDYSMVLGWGRLSNQEFVDTMDMSHQLRTPDCDTQSKRWNFCESWHLMESVSTIPANEDIEDTIKDIVEGDIVYMTGYLVDAKSPEFVWLTSLDFPTKRLQNSGKVFYVKQAHILEGVEPISEPDEHKSTDTSA